MVRFNPKARLDRSRVRDVGGSGGGVGSGMRLPIPGGIGGKGGIGGLILVIALVSWPSARRSTSWRRWRLRQSSPAARRRPGLLTYDCCATGEDANDEPRLRSCRDRELPHRLLGVRTRRQVPSRRGAQHVQRSGRHRLRRRDLRSVRSTAPGRDDLPGHHVLRPGARGPARRSGRGLRRDLRARPRVRPPHLQRHRRHGRSEVAADRPEIPGVRLELQADCFAGMWAKAATTIEDDNGEVMIIDITEQDIELATRRGGSPSATTTSSARPRARSEEAWTHGSSAQRQYWFTQGYEADSMRGLRDVRHRQRRQSSLTQRSYHRICATNGRWSDA